MDQKEEIKTRLDIIDIIGEYVTLKPAGANHKALCPFHSEKTPSFMVSRDRQMWRCFGCSEGGDVFSFVMKIEGLDFPEALRLLAQKAGITLRRADPQLTSRRNVLLEVVEAAAGWWQELLQSSPEAAAAREYVASRGISSAAAETFGLGWAPDSWEATSAFLRQRGFSEHDIFESGLSVKKERGAGFYDRFRNRLQFPIHNAHGQVIGFGGRTLDPKETGAKYINTPATAIYNKGVVVYNLHRAKSEIRSADSAVLVEGYLDVVASWEAGVKNVVAVSGTALTADQIRLLKRFSSNIALAFDMDAAGVAAASRGIELMLTTDCNVQVIQLPFGKDPDECVRKDPAAWRQAVVQAVGFMEYSFATTLARYPLTTASNKKTAAAQLLAIIAKLGNAVERAHWLQRLANVLDVPEQILREALPTQSRSAPAAAPVSPAPERTRRQRLEERLVSLLLYRTEHLGIVLQWLGPDHLAVPMLQQIFRELVVYATQAPLDANGRPQAGLTFRGWFRDRTDAPAGLSDHLDALEMLAEREYGEFTPQAISHEVSMVCSELRRDYLRDQLKQLQGSLQAAEREGKPGVVEQLSRQFDELTNQRRLLGE